MQNDRFIRALLKQPVDRTPIWMMRQAGRYLPEYRATRQRAGDFLTLCKTPELACEVTLQPLDRFALDASIIFSDILTIPDAMGLGLYFSEGEGPKFKNPIRNTEIINQLKIPDPNDDLKYVMDALRMVKSHLHNKIPLIGFSGSPWTLATYMIEGGASKNFSLIKKMLYQEPAALQQLLDKLADAVILYLNAQIEAGADAVMIFDSWGGVLSPYTYQIFSLNYMAKIINGLTKKRDTQKIPSIIFTKGGGLWLTEQANIGANALGLDWTIDIKTARDLVGDKVALQGNLDPSALYATPEILQTEIIQIMDAMRGFNGHIFNLGHGIHLDAPIDNVHLLIKTVHEYSR